MAKRKNLWLIIITSILLALHLPIFIYAALAFSNPAAYNYRRDYLDESELADYLSTSEYRIALIFAAILFVFLIIFLLDLIFRKKSTHIATVLAGVGIAFALALTRSIWCFVQGGINIVVGVINILAVIGLAACLYFYFKKAMDGDSNFLYMVSLFVALAGMMFGCMTQHSYSVLNALGHQGDVVYWSCYGVTRLTILTFALLSFINKTSDYDPDAEAK